VDKIKVAIKKIIVFLYGMVFKEAPGPKANEFIKNLGYVALTLGIAKALIFVFQIVVARILGVSEYGKYTVIFSLSQILYIFLTLGITGGFVKYLSEKEDKKGVTELLSTTAISLSSIGILVVSAMLLLSPHLSALLQMPQKYFLAALLLAIVCGIWTYSQTILRGLKKPRIVGNMHAVLNIVAFVFVVGLFYYEKGAIAPLIAISAGHIASSCLALPTFMKYFRFRFQFDLLKKIVNYSKYIFLGSLFNAGVLYFNSLLLNSFMTFKEVGLYQAYNVATMGITSFVASGLLSINFFPVASAYKRKDILFKKMNKLIIRSPLFFIGILISSVVIFVFYGKEYALDFYLLFAFSLASILMLIHLSYIWFSASINTQGAKNNAISVFISLVSLVVVGYVLIPMWGIWGAVSALISCRIVGLVVLFKLLNSMEILKKQT